MGGEVSQNESGSKEKEISMRIFVIVLALIVLPMSAKAEPCMGYQNAMHALEVAVADAQGPQGQSTSAPQRRRVTSVPPIDDINQSIDNLEAAIVAHRMKNDEALTPRRNR